jgi:serine/threonine protein kinase
VGGTGEVYRAIDNNLKQRVAIKVLPTSMAADSERLARFQPEVEALTALNHPHIAAISGLEKSDDTIALLAFTDRRTYHHCLERFAGRRRGLDDRIQG